MLLTLTNIQGSYFSFFRPLELLGSPARLGRSLSLPFLLLDHSGFRGVTSGAITSPSWWGQITRDIFLMWISFSPGWTDIRIALVVEFSMRQYTNFLWCYLRLGEFLLQTPLDKYILGCFYAVVISLLAVDPDHLLSEVPWQKFRHLRRGRAAQSCFWD